MSRYDVDKFDPTPDPDLMCCICTCILDQPLVSPCQHVFCKLCIEKWLERKKTCPTCRTQILKDELHPVLPLVRNMLNRLTMICDFKQNGCDKVLNMEQFDAHVKDCDFEMVTCRFEHCLKSVLRRDIRQHEENDCDFKEVKCPTCELDVQVKEMSVHNCVAALKNRLKGLENTIKELEDSYKASKEENNDLVKKLEEARWQTLDDSWDSNSIWDSWDSSDSHNDYSRSNTFSDGDNSSFMEFYPPFPSTFDSNATDPLGLNVNNVDLPSLIIQSPVSFPSVIDTRVAVRSQDETMSVSASENSDNSDRHVTRQNQRLVSERTHSDTNQNQSFLDGYTTLGSAVEEAFRSSAQSVLQTHYQQVSSYESSPSPIRYVSDSPATNNQTRSECNPRSPPEQTASDHGHTSSSVTRVSDQGGTPSSSVIKDVLLAPRNRNRSRRVSTSSISTIYSNVSISSLSPVCNRKSEYCDSASGHSRERSKSYEPSDHYSRHRSRSYEPSDHYSRHRSRSYEQSDHYSRHRSRSSRSSDHYSRERSRSYEPSVDSRSVSSEHARRLDSSDRPRLFERSFCSSVQLSEHVYRRSRSSENYGRRSRSSEHFSRSRSRSPENSILNSTGSRSSQHSVRSWLRSLNNSGRSRSRSSEHCGKSRSWLSNHARSWSPSSDNSRGRSGSSRHSRRNIYRSTNHTRRRSWSSDNSRSRSSSRHSGKNIYRLANHTRSRSWSGHSGNRRSRLSDHTKLGARGRSWSRSEYSGRSRSRSQHSGRSKSKSDHSGWSRSKLSHHSRHSSKSRSDLPDQHKRRSRSLEHSFGSRPALLNHSESSESEVSNPSGTPRYSKTRLRSAIRKHFKSFESKCYPKNMRSETKSKSRNSSPSSKGSLKSPSRLVSCSSPSNDSTVVGSTQSSDSGHGEKKPSSTSLKLAKQQSILPFLKYSSTSESSNCHLKNSSNSTNASKSAKKSIFLCNSKKKPASKMSVTKSFHFDSSSLSTELNSVDTCSKSTSRIVNNVSTDGSGINFVRMAKNKGNNKHATTVKSAGEQDINMSNGMQHSLFTNNSVVMQNNIELSISNPRKRKKGANQDSVEQRKTKRIKLTTSESGSTVGDSPKVNVKINLSLLNCPGGIQTNSSATSLEHSRTSPLLKTGGLPISTKPSSVVNSKRSSQTNQKINDETESILDVPTNDMRSVVFRNHTKQENATSNSVSSVSRSYSFRKSTIEKISSHPLESHSEPSIENLRRSSRRPVTSSNVSAAASLPSYLLADDTDASWSPNHLDEDSDISFSEHDTSATDSSYEVQVPKPLMQIIDEIVEDDDSDKSWTAGS